MTAPVTRRQVASDRFAASALLLITLVVVGVITAVALGTLVSLFDDVGIGRMMVATLAVAEIALLHLAIAFAAGAVTGRRGPAIATASGIAVGSYVLYGLAASADAIKALRVISPWWWLLDRNLLVQSPTFLALGLPLLLAAAIFVYGVSQFDRRDLRFP